MSLLAFTFTIFVIFLNTQKVIAQEQVKAPKIKWFQSNIVQESKNTEIYTVQLHGMTHPGTKVKLNNSQSLVVQEFGPSSGLELPAPLYNYLNSSQLNRLKSIKKVRKSCNLRSKPNSRAKSNGFSKVGEQIKVVAKNKNWFLLKHNKRKVYIHKSCLTAVKNKSSKVKKIITTSANSEGLFIATFVLPAGMIQVPLKFEFKNSKNKSILIVFEVSEGNVKTNLKFSTPPKIKLIKKSKPNKKKLHKRKKNSFAKSYWWIDAGPIVSYQVYSQKILGRDKINFSNLKTPALMLRLGADYGNWSFSIAATESSAELEGAQDPYALDPTAYTWRDLSLQTFYKLSNLKLKFGLQQKTFPFIAADNTQSLQVGTAVINNLLLGTKYSLRITDTIKWFFGVDLQIPLSNTVEVNQKGELKGKVGASIQTAIRFDLSTSYYLSGVSSVTYQSNSFSYISGSSNDSGELDYTEGRLGILFGVKF